MPCLIFHLTPAYVSPGLALISFPPSSSLSSQLPSFLPLFLPSFYFFIIFYGHNIYITKFLCLKILFLFLERGKGREKEKERNINVWLPLTWPPLGTWPTTQACALLGNQNGDPLVHSPCWIHWATPARAIYNKICHFNHLSVQFSDINYISSVTQPLSLPTFKYFITPNRNSVPLWLPTSKYFITLNRNSLSNNSHPPILIL